MKSNRGKRSRRLVIEAWILALGTTACPGDDGGGTGGSDTTAATTVATSSGSSGASTTVADSTDAMVTTEGSTPTGPDDGTATTGETAETGDTTGSTAECGNGVPEPGEDCDDGNEVDADGCNRDCTISGSIVFEHSQAGGNGVDEEAYGVAVGDDDSVYLVGDIHQVELDWFVRGYTPEGGLGFTSTFDPAANDGARGVAIYGPDLHVAGHGNANAYLVRFQASDGQIGPQIVHTGNGGGTDQGHAVAVDSAGHVLFAGFQVDNYVAPGPVFIPNENGFVRRYDAGAVAWGQVFMGPINTGHDRVLGVAVDGADDVVAVGYQSVSGQGHDMWVHKLASSNGAAVWGAPQTFAGAAALDDEAHAVAVGPDDTIVVVGFETTMVAAAMPVLWMRKYDPDGNELWSQTWPGDTAEGVQGLGVAIDDAGDISVTGFEIAAGVPQMFVRKYSALGDLKWSTAIPGTFDAGGGVNRASVGRAVAIGPDQRVWVAGGRDLGVDGRDLYVASLAP